MGVEPRDALREAVAAVESAAPGASHSELASQTQRVAWLVARGELDEREALEAFRAAGDRRGKPAAEVDAAWASAMAKAAPASSPSPTPKASPPVKKAPAAKKTLYPGLDDAARRTSFAMGKPHWGTWVYRDAGGVDAMAIVRYGDGETKEFRPYHPEAGGWVVGDPSGLLPLYRLPELVRDPTCVVAVCEGEKAADLAAGLGVPATTASHGSKSPHKTDWSPLSGRKVAILPDADEAGEKYAASVAGLLGALSPPAEVRIVRLPGLPPKGDVEQFIQAGGSAERLRELIEAAPPETGDDGPPTIVITTDIESVNDAVLEALERDPGLYRLGWSLVTVLDSGEAPRGVEYGDVAPPQVRPIPPPILRERIATRARLVKVKRRGDMEELVPALPPDWCVSALHTRGTYPRFRPLDGVILAPTIRPDGSILDRPGYDPATRLFYRPTIQFPEIPANPTRAEAVTAVALLLDLVCDFPFRGEADRIVWLASLLTVLARASFRGPAPLFGFDGNCPGAGKSLLADAVAAIVMGGVMPRMTFPGGRDGDTEMDKRILSLAMAGDRMTLLDNVAEPLGGASLDAALTTGKWKGRPLGRSEIVTLQLDVTWFASGNNLAVRGDTLRRVLFARIEATEENPEERTGFKHPDLIGHILEDRGRLVAAALTILRAYHLAGRPPTVKPLGSFEGWSRAIADPVAWITGVDPMDVREHTKADDQDGAARTALVAGWAELPNSERGLTVAEAYKLLQAPGQDDKFTTLRAVLAELSNDGELPKAKSIGRHLLNLKGRVVGGMKILGELDRKRTMAWRVEKTAGFAGFDDQMPGLDSPQTRHVKSESDNDMHLDAGFAGFEAPLPRVENAIPGNFLACRPEINPANPSNPAIDSSREVFAL